MEIFSVYFACFNAVYLPEVSLPSWIRASARCCKIGRMILMTVLHLTGLLHAGLNLTLPAGLQVREGDGRVWEADLSAFFIPVAVLFRNGRELFDFAVVTLSFLTPITAVVACGGRRSLSTTPEHQLWHDKPFVLITQQLLPLLVQQLSSLGCDILRVFLDCFYLPLPSVAKHAVLVDLHGDKHEIPWPDGSEGSQHACEGYLKEESKSHDQVRRWQIVLLSWKTADQTSQTASVALQNLGCLEHTSDHETSCGQVLSSGSRLWHL